MAQNFSWKQDIKKVDWASTLKYNLMRAVSAGIVWGFVMLITDPAKNALPALFAPIFFPAFYLFLVTVVFGVLALYARSPFPFAELIAGLTMLVWAFVVAVGDPLIFLLHKRKPGFVPVDQPRFFDFHLIVFVLRDQFQPKRVPHTPVAPSPQISQVAVPPIQPANSSLQPTPPSSGNQVPVSIPIASGSFFTSKPFIMLVAIAVMLCGGVALFKSLSDKTILSFDFSLDGKGLPSSKVPEVKVDGQPFTSGSKIKMGKHELAVQLQNVETYGRTFWVFFGKKDLGILPLETSKGSLVVTVNPSPATVLVQRDGQTVTQGAAPLNMDKLPVGNYTLVVKRGDYEETHAVEVRRQQTTNEIVELNLGKVELSSIPADSSYEMSGNGHRWQGKLPARLEDIPAGDYSLSVTRRDWNLNSDVSVIRGGIATNKTEYPYGSIAVTSTPTGLAVSTNSVVIGKTPITLQELKPAVYTLTISDGENDLTANVNVGARENIAHDFIFRYGSVQLISTPPGAAVVRKGKEVGKTPITLDHIPAGESHLELKLDGYVTTNTVISATENAVANIAIKLINENYIQALDKARAAFAGGQYAEARSFFTNAISFSSDAAEVKSIQEDIASVEIKAEEVRKEKEKQAIIDLIEKAIVAHGGRDVLIQFTASREVSLMVGKLGNGNDYSVRATTYIQLPDKIRTDHDTRVQQKSILGALSSLGLQVTVNGHAPDQDKLTHSIYYVSGRDTYSMTDGVIQPLSDRMAQNLSDLCYYDECEKLVKLLDGSYQLEKVDGESSAIKVRKAGKPDIILTFSKDTGLLLEIEYIENDMGGSGKIHVKNIYSEYRNVSGVMLPMHLLVKRAGQADATIVIQQKDVLRSFPDQIFNFTR